jgi:hypothetical protein
MGSSRSISKEWGLKGPGFSSMSPLVRREPRPLEEWCWLVGCMLRGEPEEPLRLWWGSFSSYPGRVSFLATGGSLREHGTKYS